MATTGDAARESFGRVLRYVTAPLLLEDREDARIKGSMQVYPERNMGTEVTKPRSAIRGCKQSEKKRKGKGKGKGG
ncbi:MAG: hypothetical protein AABY08_01355 [Candidatus Thermoplasmatota archaeon]